MVMPVITVGEPAPAGVRVTLNGGLFPEMMPVAVPFVKFAHDGMVLPNKINWLAEGKEATGKLLTKLIKVGPDSIFKL